MAKKYGNAAQKFVEEAMHKMKRVAGVLCGKIISGVEGNTQIGKEKLCENINLDIFSWSKQRLSDIIVHSKIECSFDSAIAVLINSKCL